jgi:hypothetical protein
VLSPCLHLEELYVGYNDIITVFSDWLLTILNLRVQMRVTSTALHGLMSITQETGLTNMAVGTQTSAPSSGPSLQHIATRVLNNEPERM